MSKGVNGFVWQSRIGVFLFRLRCLIILLLATAASIVMLLVVSGISPAEPTAVMSIDDFDGTKGFFKQDLIVHPREVPSSIHKAGHITAWRSWSPETGGTTGELVSKLFKLPPFLAVSYTGFPGEVSGNRISLLCEGERRETPVATLRTNNQWATVFLYTAGFCSGPVRLVASVVSANHYIGVSVPFEVSAPLHWLHSSFWPRVLIVFMVWCLLLLLAFPTVWLVSRLEPLLPAVAVAFVSVGVISMVVLVGFTVSAKVGMVVSWGTIALYSESPESRIWC